MFLCVDQLFGFVPLLYNCDKYCTVYWAKTAFLFSFLFLTQGTEVHSIAGRQKCKKMAPIGTISLSVLRIYSDLWHIRLADYFRSWSGSGSDLQSSGVDPCIPYTDPDPALVWVLSIDGFEFCIRIQTFSWQKEYRYKVSESFHSYYYTFFLRKSFYRDEKFDGSLKDWEK